MSLKKYTKEDLLRLGGKLDARAALSDVDYAELSEVCADYARMSRENSGLRSRRAEIGKHLTGLQASQAALKKENKTMKAKPPVILGSVEVTKFVEEPVVAGAGHPISFGSI